MTSLLAASPSHTCSAFRHEALLYSGFDEFVDRASAFIDDGLRAGEPVLVMVTADKIELLRAALGEDRAARVEFADMGEIGLNPGRIISAWTEFATRHMRGRRSARGIGEPIWTGRDADELVECQHHEQLLNVAFADAAGFTLLCPYDTSTLEPAVIAEARCSHPCLREGEQKSASASYLGIDAIAGHVPDEPLAEPREPVTEVSFDDGGLVAVRAVVSQHAEEAGLDSQRTEDLVMAAHEAATNSVRHGGGSGVLRVWEDDGAAVCEIRDEGTIEDPLVGRRRPVPGKAGGYGLWLAHQVCDLVQVRSAAAGTVVRLSMRLQT